MGDDQDKVTLSGKEGGEPKPPAKEPETLEEALAELARLKEKAALNHDRWLRAAAEAENMRRRCEREKSDYLKYATEKLIRDLLPVVDNLERALDHAAQGDSPDASLQQGVELTLRGLRSALEGQGVVAIEALGSAFDPHLHEAVSVEERSGVADNEVVAQLQKGYLLKDRLLRPALVVVAKAVTEQPSAAGPEEDSD